MRLRYRQNPKTLEMEPINDAADRKERGILVCPDISPFKSVVDGSVITGRRALREHNLRNNVTFTEDFRGDWENARKVRESMYSGDSKFDRRRRIEAIKRAVDQQSNRRR